MNIIYFNITNFDLFQNKLLNNKWFFFKNKLTVYTNIATPANQFYISSSNPILYVNIAKNINPLDITGVDRNSLTALDLVINDPITQNQSHLLWTDILTRKYSLNLNGLAWNLRELQEFFGINALVLPDTRNILLDYSFTVNPLKKYFPTQGLEEVYFNFYTQQVELTPTNFVEL